MKNGLRIAVIGFSLAAVVGCGGNRNVRVDATPIAADERCTELRSGITDQMARGVADIKYRLDMAEGNYCQAYQNQAGIFYIGPRGNLVEYGNSGHKLIFNGGFFVPHDSALPIQWWKLTESTQVIDEHGKTVGRTEFDRLMGFPKAGIVLSQSFSPSNSNALRKLHASVSSNQQAKPTPYRRGLP